LVGEFEEYIEVVGQVVGKLFVVGVAAGVSPMQNLEC